jgi:soluble lytic murein transglycosylase-like protein
MPLNVPYAVLIIAAGQRYNVEPELIAAVIHWESGFDPNASGDDGHSIGLMQLHDQGAGAGWTVEQRRDPATNIDVGAAYLRRCLDATAGSIPDALSAYNQGIGGWRERGRSFNPRYVDGVYALYALYGGAVIPISGAPLPPLAVGSGCATKTAGAIVAAIVGLGGLLAWLI